MTETPGWASPGSPEPGGEGADPRDAASAESASRSSAAGEAHGPEDAAAEAAAAKAAAAEAAAAAAAAAEDGTAAELRDEAVAQAGDAPVSGAQALGAPVPPAPVPPGLPGPAGPHGGWAPPPGWGPPMPGFPGGPGWPPPAPGWGWQHAWVPKPGVIPLRPLGVGEILDGAITTMRTYWRTVLGISVVVSVVIELIVQCVNWLLERGLGRQLQTLQAEPTPDWHQIGELYAKIFSGSMIAGGVTLLGTLVATALLTMVVGRAVLGRPATLAEVWADARPRLLRLLGLSLLTAVIGVGVVLVAFLPGVLAAASGAPSAAVGLLLAVVGLAGVLVDIWLMVRLSLAAPVLMLEKQGILASLGRSFKLVGGSWWRVFWISLLTGIVVTLMGGVIEIPFAMGALIIQGSSSGGLFAASTSSNLGALVVSGIGAAIGTALTMPISAAVRVLLYIDQRIRREALDIELARAAGLPDYGVPAQAGV